MVSFISQSAQICNAQYFFGPAGHMMQGIKIISVDRLKVCYQAVAGIYYRLHIIAHLYNLMMLVQRAGISICDRYLPVATESQRSLKAFIVHLPFTEPCKLLVYLFFFYCHHGTLVFSFI
jgi:hypothetical protein